MFSSAYKRYVLGTLTLVYTWNYVDRGLITLLLQPIKEDLRLSDTQLGFLTGIAFGLLYATLGLPFGRWADRGNRVTITSIAIGLWGVTVMLCLFVSNFVQLLLARVAAGVGEAGCMPPTYSLVGDYFPSRAERARALSIYMLANPFSALVSFIVGGWLNELYGWRVTFFLIGIPGLLFAGLVRFTIAEPRLNVSPAVRVERKLPRMTEVLRILWHQHSSRHLIIAYILLLTMVLGLAPWYGAFMTRSHGMRTAELGIWLGLIGSLGPMIGILFGGYVAERWFARDEQGQMRLSAAMIASAFPCFLLFLLLPQKHQALAALVPLFIVLSLFLAPTFSLLQRLVPDEMRATTLSVVMLLANLIGMGIGPQVVGILSDRLAPVLGAESLRYAMLAMSLIALWSAFHFWRVGSSVQADLSAIVQRAGSNVSQTQCRQSLGPAPCGEASK